MNADYSYYYLDNTRIVGFDLTTQDANQKTDSL